MDEELKLQLFLLDIKYQYAEIDFKKIIWKKFFIDASNNRILDYCCRKLIQLGLIEDENVKASVKTILLVADGYYDKIKLTLNFLNTKLAKYPFLICKTEKDIGYVTFDVDVLFKKKDYWEILSHLQKLGGKYIECKNKLQADIIFTDLLRIDTHINFHWQKSVFISEEKLWKNTTLKKVFGIKCYTPNLDNEVILNLLNLIYERHYIPLLDYYFLLKHVNNVNWNEIISVAIKYNWIKGLQIILNKFNQIHFFLNNRILIDIDINNKNYKFTKVNKLKIPFIYTYREGIHVFSERIFKCHYFRLYEFLYFLFSKTRFDWFDNSKVPIYGHWYDFKQIKY